MRVDTSPVWIVFIVLAGLAHATVVTNHTVDAANKTFDYVIVGAGLSGITVANKLSERGFSVLVIEAGPDARWYPGINNAEGRVQHDSYCNWLYPAYQDDGTVLSQAIDAGSCVGGSTSINGMVWNRPTTDEIDKLETLGNTGWNWNNLEPFMTAIERNIPPDELQIEQGAWLDPDVHGFHGAMNVSFPTPMRIPNAVALYKEALMVTFPGLSISNDLSDRSGDTTVSSSTSWTIWYDPETGKNRRSSAADGLLWAPGQQRGTLTVLTNHKVDKIFFSPARITAAAGVVFGTRPGSHVPGSLAGAHMVHAAREVILAAGALASASVLERSGIGSAGVLQAAGIEQIVDLPGVGANLVDQPGTGAAALVAEEYQNDTSIIDGRTLFAPEISLVNVEQIWPGEVQSYYDDLSSPENLQSRAQELVSVGGAVNVEGASAILNTSIDLIVNHHYPVVEFVAESSRSPAVLTAIFWPLMPLSRGHVHINSSDPFEDQIIVPRFLMDSFDQQIAVAVSRRAGALFSSAPFAAVVADPYHDPALGPSATDEAYLDWYRATSYGASHWMGSTAMLPRELGGVVDSELRVYGTSGLRVVDAGILPFEITSHTMSLMYAVAQRAAALILGAT